VQRRITRPRSSRSALSESQVGSDVSAGVSGDLWVQGEPPLDGQAKLRQVVSEGFPDDVVINRVVDVVHDDPHSSNVVPGDLAGLGEQLVRKLGGDVADSPDDCLSGEPERPLVVPPVLAAGDQLA
jgi:hypothetical protein